MIKSKKLLLIVPNWRWVDEEKNVNYPYPPYNLCLLAAIVRDLVDVTIIDAYVDDLSINELTTEIKKQKPDIVGVTVLMDQLASAGHKVTEIAKSINKDIITIMGGVYVTINSNRAISDKHLDYAFIGEAEISFLHYIEYILGKKDFLTKGIAYKDKDEIVHLGRADFIENLDEIPYPAWDLIDFDAYSKYVAREFSPDSPRDLPYVRLYTARGCPFNCSFCQVPAIAGNKVRRHSVKRILDELQWLKETYNIKSFMNSDDNFLAGSQTYLRDLLNGMIERNLNMPWILEDVGVMHLNERILRLMAESGCQYMGFAVETGVERISKEIIAGKPLKKDHTKKMLKLAKDLGIFCSANFIIGFPTETWDEIRETIHFAEELDADYTRFHILVPLKGTKIMEIVENDDLLNKSYDHFNETATWLSGSIESKSKEYTSEDLTILKAMEWDRVNFTKPEKRKKIADWLRISEDHLMKRRRTTIENIQINLNKFNDRAFGCSGNTATRFERAESALPVFERVDSAL